MLLRRIAPRLVVALALCGLSAAVSAQSPKVPPPHVDTEFYRSFTVAPFQVYVSDTGRINAIRSPASISHNGNSDYELCTPIGNYQASTGGFQPIPGGVAQPNGDGKLPLSISVKTPDSQWQIKWTYTVNATEMELTLAAAVKRTGYPAYVASLELGTDFDVYSVSGSQVLNTFDASRDTAWQKGADSTNAWALLGLIRNKFTRTAYVTNWANIYNPGCSPAMATSQPADVASGVTYNMGSVSWNATPVAKFQYNRH